MMTIRLTAYSYIDVYIWNPRHKNRHVHVTVVVAGVVVVVLLLLAVLDELASSPYTLPIPSLPISLPIPSPHLRP